MYLADSCHERLYLRAMLLKPRGWMVLKTPSRMESSTFAVAKGIAPPLYPHPNTTPTTGSWRLAISEIRNEMLCA